MKTSVVAFALSVATVPLSAGAQTQDPPPPPPPPMQPWRAYVPPAYQSARPPRPVLIPYEEGTPVPPGARIVTRPRLGLIITGASIFGSVWLLTAMAGTLVSSSGSRDEGLWLALPVIGPFVYAAASDRVSSAGAFWLVFDGLVQGGALTMLVVGATNPGRYVAYDQVVARAPRWMLTPGFAGGPGASLRVTF